MLDDVAKGLLGPLFKTWRFVRQLEREIVKDDGDTTLPRCEATRGRRLRRRRCTLASFHDGAHRFGDS